MTAWWEYDDDRCDTEMDWEDDIISQELELQMNSVNEWVKVRIEEANRRFESGPERPRRSVKAAVAERKTKRPDKPDCRKGNSCVNKKCTFIHPDRPPKVLPEWPYFQ